MTIRSHLLRVLPVLLGLLLPFAVTPARADALPAFNVATTGADPVGTAAATTYYCTTNNCTTSGTRNLWASDYPVEIKALADALDDNVDRIYAYVHDNIEIVPIFGLQKGAVGALIDRSGTAFDQAQLMVELLRQAGYTASYVRGTITLSGAQLQDWLGTQNLNAAKRILADGGIPADVVASGSNVASVTLMHVWVQATIGGSSYVFDPAFKSHARTAALNLGTAMGWNETNFLSAAQSGMSTGMQSATGDSGGTVSIPYVSNVNGANVNSQLAAYANTLVNYLRNIGYAARQIEDVIGRQDIIAASSVPLRQTSLSYGSPAATWAGNIPDVFRTKLTTEMLQLNTRATLMSQTFYTDEVYGRRLLFDTYMDGMIWSDCAVRIKVDGRYVGPIYNCTDRADGRRAYVRLSIDHPYAANGGTWLDQSGSNAVVKIADFTSPVAVVLGLGEVSDRLPSKLASEQDNDRLLPETTFYVCGPDGCDTTDKKPQQPNQESALVQSYASWLAQYQQMAMLQSRSLSAVHQLHHSLGVAFRRSLVTVTNPKGDPNNLGDAWTVSQSGLVLDVDSAVSVTSENDVAADRGALVRSLEATADTLEASVFEQLNNSATPASVAHRFADTSSNTPATRYYLLTKAATSASLFPSGSSPYFYGSIYNELSTYTGASYKVIVSADEFMGPGRPCSGAPCSATNFVYFERGGAFQAFAPDGLSMASIVTDATGYWYKGGASGDPPVYDTEYAPDKSAGLLKDAFKDRSRDLGIDLASGDFTYSPGEDVSVGLGDFPYKLSLQRSFKPTGSHSPGLGKGWTHNLDHRLSMNSSGMEALGQHSTLAAASTLVALYATRQLYATVPPTDQALLQRWIVAPIVQGWWASQIRFNAVTYTAGGSSKVFVRLADGSFLPPGGYLPGDASSYWKLTQSGSPSGYGNKWVFSTVNFTLTSPAQDVQTYAFWHQRNQDVGQPYFFGGHHGWHLTTWTWPQGVSLTFNYVASDNSTNTDDLLLSAQNSLGRRINLSFGTAQSDWDACNFLAADDDLGHATSYNCANASTAHPINAYGETTEVSRLVYGSANCDRSLWPDRSRRPRCAPYLTQIYAPSDTASPKASVTYDAVGALKTYADAQALKLPGSRDPYLFRIANGVRGERIDPAGHSYIVDYDPWGRAVRFTDELGRVATAAYDGLGHVLKRVSPGGITTNFQYDFRGSVTQLQQVPSRSTAPTVPATLSVAATYDAGCGRLKTVTDALGKVTTWNYNTTTCQTTSVVQPAVPNAAAIGSPVQNPTTQYAYTAAGLLDYLIDPSGVKIDYTYDASGNRTKRELDPAGIDQTTSYGYNPAGSITSVTDGRGKTTGYTYDDSRRLYRVTGHTGTCIRTDIFYTGGLKTAVKAAKVCSPDPATPSHWQTTTTSYTPTGQADTVTDPDGNTTQTTYDPLDRPIDTTQQLAANPTHPMARWPRRQTPTATSPPAPTTAMAARGAPATPARRTAPAHRPAARCTKNWPTTPTATSPATATGTARRSASSSTR